MPGQDILQAQSAEADPKIIPPGLPDAKPEGGIDMIFRKIAVRPVPAMGLDKASFVANAPRRLTTCWRRNEETSRLTLVWKLIDVQDNKRAA